MRNHDLADEKAIGNIANPRKTASYLIPILNYSLILHQSELLLKRKEDR